MLFIRGLTVTTDEFSLAFLGCFLSQYVPMRSYRDVYSNDNWVQLTYPYFLNTIRDLSETLNVLTYPPPPFYHISACMYVCLSACVSFSEFCMFL